VWFAPGELGREIERSRDMMKRDLPHPAVPEPKDLTAEAWRYSPLSQLLSVLLVRSLPLIRVDRLGDPFEGSVTDEIKARDIGVASQMAGKPRWANLAGTMMPQAPLTPTDVLEQLSRHRIAVLRSTHASCWRMGRESEGMWRLYCGQKDGVAMRTTCAKLKASITDDATRLGEITYIDYSAGGMPADNYLYPVMHKRDGFADEHEVRLLRYLQDYIAEGVEERDGIKVTEKHRRDPGFQRAVSELMKDITSERSRTDKLYDQIAAHTGVYCMSKRGDSILQWSYYAKGHSGFCLEFTIPQNAAPPFDMVVGMEYVRDRESVDVFDLISKNNKDYLWPLVRRKLDRWQHEEEVRAFVTRSGVTRFAPETLTGVIFGTMTADPHKQWVRQTLEQGGLRVRYYQLERSYSHFELARRELT
jgi:hypothetical protein